MYTLKLWTISLQSAFAVVIPHRLTAAKTPRIASGKPRHCSFDAYCRLTCKEVARLIASLQRAAICGCFVKTLCVTLDLICRALHSRENRFSSYAFSLRSRMRKSASSTVSVYSIRRRRVLRRSGVRT